MRLQQEPWLADHVVFFSYRWLTWVIAAQALLWATYPSGYGWMILFGAVLNIALTWFAQAYDRIVQNYPLILILDILIMISMLNTITHYNHNALLFCFLPYALSSIMLPALIWSWRGGLIAGLAFVMFDRLALFVQNINQTPAFSQGWLTIAILMLVPPIFGYAFPFYIDWLRQRQIQRKQEIVQQHWSVFDQHDEIHPNDSSDMFGYGKPSANDLLEPFDLPISLRNQTVRTMEPNTEALRRKLFTPLPASDMPLNDIIETLILRFAQQSGTNARYTLLGKPQQLPIAYNQILIRLTQEALLNVQQHAHANSLVCTLRYDIASVVLLVQDNGIGLPNGSYERPGLHALRAMHYRLAEQGGRLDIFDTQGGGVTVRASIPIETSNVKP